MILDRYPVEYMGYLLRTDYRVGIQITLVLEDFELDDDERVLKALELLYGYGIPDDINLALNGLKWFMSCGKKCSGDSSTEYLDTNEFNSLFDNKNWLFAVLQLIFLGFVLTIWYKYNYIQCYFNNLQIKYQSKEPLFKRLKKFENLYHSEHPDFYEVINKHFEHVSSSDKIKVANS